MERHEALRTVARVERGLFRARRLATPGAESLFQIEDLGQLPPPEREAAFQDSFEAFVTRPFDLGADILARARLWRHGPGQWSLVILVHHGAVDGASQAVLARDLAEAYASLVAGRSPALAPLRATYSDLEQSRQAALEASGAIARQLEFWRRQLAGAPTRLRLPTDHPHLPGRRCVAGEIPIAIEADLFARVQAVARDAGSSVFAAIVAAWAQTLGQLAGQEDVLLATNVSRREAMDAGGVVGPLINTALLRLALSDTISLARPPGPGPRCDPGRPGERGCAVRPGHRVHEDRTPPGMAHGGRDPGGLADL